MYDTSNLLQVLKEMQCGLRLEVRGLRFVIYFLIIAKLFPIRLL